MRWSRGVALVAAAMVVAGVLLLANSGGGDAGPAARTGPVGAAPTTTSTAPRGPRGSGQPVVIAFAGDVHFPAEQLEEPGVTSTGIPVLADQLRADPTKVLAPIAPTLSGADLTIANLETAITDRGEPVAGKKYHFRSSAQSFTALKSAGVDLVTMANNHALDYGPEGLQDTLAAIDASKMPTVGIGRNAAEAFRPYRTTIKGQRIAVVAAVDWVEPAVVDSWTATDTQAGLAFSIDPTRLLDAVRAARVDTDTLIVFMHWGTEDTWCASVRQRDLAYQLFDAGADVVVGTHTHRVFGAGRLDGHFVAYGLGNFVYFREDGESGRSGVLLVTATGRDVDSYAWVPTRITHGIPVPQTGQAAADDLATWESRRTCSALSP